MVRITRLNRAFIQTFFNREDIAKFFIKDCKIYTLECPNHWPTPPEYDENDDGVWLLPYSPEQRISLEMDPDCTAEWWISFNNSELIQLPRCICIHYSAKGLSFGIETKNKQEIPPAKLIMEQLGLTQLEAQEHVFPVPADANYTIEVVPVGASISCF